MQQLLKIFTILTNDQKRTCALLFVLMLIGACLEAFGIGLIWPLISVMGQPNFLQEHHRIGEYMMSLGITTHIQFVIFIAFGLIVVYLAKNTFIAWELRTQINFAMKNQVHFARHFFGNYLAKPYIFYLDHNTAQINRNVTLGANVAFSNILIPTLQLFTEIITGLVIWIMLIIADPFTSIVSVSLLGGIIYFLIAAFRKKIMAQGKAQADAQTLMVKWINQGTGSIKETKILRKEEYFLNEYVSAYQTYAYANRRFNLINQLPRLFIEMTVVAALLILIIAKVALGSLPETIVPMLGVLALAAFRLMPCANRVVNLLNTIKFQMPLFNQLYNDFIEIRNKTMRGENPLALPSLDEQIPFENKIEVSHLNFRYPRAPREVLKDISFTIPKGSFVGILGPSGVGKTTFVDILLGLLSPTSGTIYADGVDIFKNIRAWQANLAYVPQSIYLIDGTIQENIALGIPKDKIDRKLIEKVLKMAELYNFIQELPKKENTIVGERGVKLSGGQRQRIGIARALYYQPKILVLDEATSSLDNATEKAITATILKLKGHMTIISIAHRVSTLENCDFRINFKNSAVEIIKNP